MKIFIFLFVFLFSCVKESESVFGVNTSLPKERVEELKKFLKGKNYNQDIAIFINFKVESGKYKYFVYDLKTNTILQKAIVAHGEGSVDQNSKKLKFSNKDGSHQSSLGKYKIGESYNGKFGKAYRLDGLEDTNSNARERAIVLHSYYCVPDKESTYSTCLSFGCPMLSTKAFQKTSEIIDKAKKPIILYAFY